MGPLHKFIRFQPNLTSSILTPFPTLSRGYFDWVADHDARVRRIQRTFHQQIRAWHQRIIPPGARVVEIGCGSGELIGSLQVSYGLGLDFSPGMVKKAQERHAGDPRLEFRCLDIENETISEKFDYIVLSYLIGYLTDIEQVLLTLKALSHARTRLVLTSLNHLWSWPLKWAQIIGFVTPQPESNWLSTKDLVNLLELAGWEVIETGTEQLMPFRVPLLDGLLNRLVVRLPFFRHFGISLSIVARPRCAPELSSNISCSVIIPARNESGNIPLALSRVPVLGKRTQIIFVEGNSTDDTWAAIQREMATYKGPHLISAFKQPNRGKWDAVKLGLDAAVGDVLVIQDADLTAPPEDLAKFFHAISAGIAEFANGCRLVYPMESGAMRFLNFFGNKFFALSLSYVLGQPIKDSLCGTKMLLRSDYKRLQARIAELGEFDPFGDFNLLFGSAMLHLRIRDIPVRYKDRTYGTTNISRFRHGWLLLKMTFFGLIKIRWR